MFEDFNKEMNLSIIHKYDVYNMVKSMMKEIPKLLKPGDED